MSSVCPTDDPLSDASTWSDRMALDQIASILRAPDWEGADFLDEIALIVAGTGRSLDHSDACSGTGGWYGDGCSASEYEPYDYSRAKEDARNAVLGDDWAAPIRYRVKYEDASGEEFGSYDAFSSRAWAFAHFRSVIAEPSRGLGSLYVTHDDGSDERVVAAHSFAGAEDLR